jgi:hypothetical protein
MPQYGKGFISWDNKRRNTEREGNITFNPNPE